MTPPATGASLPRWAGEGWGGGHRTAQGRDTPLLSSPRVRGEGPAPLPGLGKGSVRAQP
jgi:hypothetical protein